MKHSLRISQRAAIGIKSFDFALEPKPRLSVWIENYGKLAARGVRSNIWGLVLGEPPMTINLECAIANNIPDQSYPTENEIMPNVLFPIPVRDAGARAQDRSTVKQSPRCSPS